LKDEAHQELRLEKNVDLHANFQLRWYQEEVWDLIEGGDIRNVLLVAARRSGKDILGWNLAVRQCIKKVCLVFYILPTYGLARRAIFDAITNDSKHFLDYIPKELIESINQSDMKIRFKNGSILQCLGGDTFSKSNVGTNPYAVVLSEFSLLPPDIFNFISPILGANGGWCLIVGTPRGKNHLWHLYKLAQQLDDWRVIYQPVSLIKHMTEEFLTRERRRLSLSGDDGMYLQEYECSFDRGISGSYYGTHLDNLRLKSQITSVSWEPGLLVHTAWDIGVNDPTTIIFYQTVGEGTVVRIIDSYSNTGLGIDHYAKILQDKPYRYGTHWAPHDIKVREFGGGAITRYEKARQLGINFSLVDQVPIIEGIENVWTHFGKLWIDADKCRSLIDALENYRKQWDERNEIFLNKPVDRNWANHYADTLRYLCLSLYRNNKGLTAEEFERKRAEAIYGNNNLPPVFRNDIKYDRYGR